MTIGSGSRLDSPAPLRSALAVATTAAVLALSGCGTADLVPAGSLDPGDLRRVEVGATLRDPETERSVTVNALVTNFPVPEDYAPAEEGTDVPDPTVVVLVDLSVVAGDLYPSIAQPSDFRLRSGDGETAEAVTTLGASLTEATLWPLEELTAGGSQRGWVAFPVAWDSLAGAELVMTRPANITTTEGQTLEPDQFVVPLGLD